PVRRLLAPVGERYRRIRIESREVIGGEIGELLLSDRFDLAIAPRTSSPRGFHTRVVRREPMGVALSRTDRLARRKRIELATAADRLFEIWPREMAPGLFDTIVGYCRPAGFEPMTDQKAAGNTVWVKLPRERA